MSSNTEKRLQRLVARQHKATTFAIIITAMIICLLMYMGAILLAPGVWDAVDARMNGWARDYPFVVGGALSVIFIITGIICIRLSK